MAHWPLHVRIKSGNIEETCSKPAASQNIGKRGNTLVSSEPLRGRARRALESLQKFREPTRTVLRQTGGSAGFWRAHVNLPYTYKEQNWKSAGYARGYRLQTSKLKFDPRQAYHQQCAYYTWEALCVIAAANLARGCTCKLEENNSTFFFFFFFCQQRSC